MVKSKALLVGCNYIGMTCELLGCINDAYNLQELVGKYYPGGEVRVMNDFNGNPPTYDNLIDNIKWLVSGATNGDSLLFAWSGHGGQSKDMNGDESADHLDECIYPMDFYNKGPITDDLLNKILVSPLPEGVKLFCIFDSCHSESVLDLKYTYKTGIHPFRNPNYQDTRAQIFCISGCMDNQTSADTKLYDPFDKRRESQGALTAMLVAAVLKNSQTASILKIMSDLRNDLKSNGYSQYPVLTTGRLINVAGKFSLL